MPWIAALISSLSLHRAHIIGAHALEGVGEQIELADRRSRRWRPGPAGSTPSAEAEAGHHAQANQAHTFFMFLSPSAIRRLKPGRRDPGHDRSGATRNKAGHRPATVWRHCADRFARQQLIVRPHRHASQSRQHQIVASGDLQDQDLSALMVRAGEKNLAIGRRDHLGAAAGWHR